MLSVPFVIILPFLCHWTSRGRGHPEKRHSRFSGTSFENFGEFEDQVICSLPRFKNNNCSIDLTDYGRKPLIH